MMYLFTSRFPGASTGNFLKMKYDYELERLVVKMVPKLELEMLLWKKNSLFSVSWRRKAWREMSLKD